MLVEARERAQHILDESMERATELLGSSRREAGDGELDAVRHALNELLSDMHDVQRRLDRIEALLSTRPAERPAAPEEEHGRSGGFSVAPRWGRPPRARR